MGLLGCDCGCSGSGLIRPYQKLRLVTGIVEIHHAPEFLVKLSQLSDPAVDRFHLLG
jgi:hypothetical protein